MRLLARTLTPGLVAAVAVAGLAITAAPAYAAPCGDGSLTFSGGQGTAASPYRISTEADLVALREGYTTTPSYYSCEYLQTKDITLTSAWEHGIGFSTPGSALYKPFNGVYDGNGNAIENLVINALPVSRPNQARELGFIGLSTSSTASVRNLDVANAVITCGFETVDAALLVGQTSGTVERSSASGDVTCSGADSIARAGGLIGYVNGAVTNSWVSGTVTLPTTSTFAPNAAGGAIGKTDTNATVQSVLSRVTIVNPLQATWVGVFVGRQEGAMLASFAQSGLTAGVGAVVGAGSPAGATLKTSTELQDITTFAGWSISSGANTSTIWGIDPAINGGYPFLQALPVPPDDPAQAPAPILQQVPRQSDGTCDGIDDRAFEYDTGLTGGWTPSWAQWARGGEGGPVCGRTLVYRGGWVIAP